MPSAVTAASDHFSDQAWPSHVTQRLMAKAEAKGSDTLQRINVTEPYDVRRGTDHFGCTAGELRKAVSAVGNVVSHVSDHVCGRKPASDPRAALEAAFNTPESEPR